MFDVGPSLGALNRTVILSCDYLITPFGCDIFSILGIQNISSWIKGWKRQYERGIENAKEDRPELLENYPIIHNTDVHFRFAGYSVQQYVTRTFRTGRRPVSAYDQIMKRIPDSVRENLDFLKPNSITDNSLELGHIPFLYSLVPLAQSLHSPIHNLGETGKLIGSQYKQVESYSVIMRQLCDRLLSNIGIA